MIHNIVSVSGGKDSTATLLLAIERETENLQAVFADTGHEHEAVYDYLDYLEQATGVTIQRVKADFSKQIAKKRKFIEEKWALKGVPDDRIKQALEVLHPTGNAFLDMCLWKGRFPSSKARFCTEELKVFPIQNQVVWPILREESATIESWQGIRWDESRARADAVEREGIEPDAGRVFAYRPILAWTANDVFDFHKKHGIKWNPLYELGMGRVGCMPCVNCRKSELQEIAVRFPEHIERLAEWERLVSMASKRGSSTFFPAVNDPTVSKKDNITHETHGIARMVEWSKTGRGGRAYDIFATDRQDGGECSSMYGLCESGG